MKSLATQKGLDKIISKITAEAESFAASEREKARKEASEILADGEKKSAEKSGEILAKAEAKASSLIENAKSSAGMRERNSMLSLKVDIMEKAFEEAEKKLSRLDDSDYIKAMSAVLSDAVNSTLSDGSTAKLCVGKRDAERAEKIIEAALPLITKSVKIEKGTDSEDISSGFILKCTDENGKGGIEINCSAKAIIDSGKSALEKKVLEILFGEN